MNKKSSKIKWFHAIGASGKTTANVAKMFKNMGWFVTGTDVQFLPPASRIIEDSNIPFELGYHFSHLTKEFWSQKLSKDLENLKKPKDWNKKLSFGKKHKDAKYRHSVGAILLNPKKDKILTLYWPIMDKNGIPQGGVDEGENEVDALKRELIEETGFTEFEIEEKLGSDITSYFYAPNKSLWRELNLSCYLVQLKSYNQIKQKLEDNEDFVLQWKSISDYLEILQSYEVNESQDFRGIIEFVNRAQYLIQKQNLEVDFSQISENPDLVMFVESISSKNKEYLFAKNKGLDVRPYSQILAEYLIKKNSIVVAGTAGKTTTTALSTKILQDLGFEPSYMIGADVQDIPESIANTESKWSVIEGDEYHSKELANGAKFLEYKPKYLIITNIGYEHQDVFPTQESYTEEFTKLVNLVPEDGIIIAKHGDKNIDKTLKNAKGKVIRYAVSDNLLELRSRPPFEGGLTGVCLWTITPEGLIRDDRGREIMQIETSLIGKYNLENILAVVTLVCSLPSSEIHAEALLQGTNILKYMQNTIANFKGPKKRLEVLYSGTSPYAQSTKLNIIDDFGVAPERAKNSLNTLAENFKNSKIIAVFEPNSASRPGDETIFKKMYKGVFKNAEQIIVPDLSSFDNSLATGEQMSSWLKDIGYTVQNIKADKINNFLQDFMKKDKKSNLVICFMSSYRLTGVAEELVWQLKI